MGKPDTKAQTQKDEFSRIFDDYRAKIEEISKKTQKSPTDDDSPSDAPAVNEAEELEVLVSRALPKSDDGKNKVISPVDIEAQDIILAAKRRAQQIIDEAEDKSRKEAKKKTQSEVDKIITKARKDALDIITQTKQSADQERNNIIVDSKNDAEQVIREITEKCRQETQAQSSRAIEEARERAEKILNEIIESGTEISQKVTDIMTRAKHTIEEFEERLKIETDELAGAIAETQRKLEQFTSLARKEEEVKPTQVISNKETTKNQTPGLRLLGQKSNGKNGTHTMFSGQVEMKSISAPFDYQYLKNLKKYLVHIPNIKYVQESASEKEMSIVFDLQEPLPLLDILKNIPLVEEVVTDADDICIMFKD
jgi:F0F1-type ATP synthase membrane subunit b/b'